jgi:hypothetical protein
MTAPDWTEFTARRLFLTPRARRHYGNGNPFEKIANTGAVVESAPALSDKIAVAESRFS